MSKADSTDNFFRSEGLLPQEEFLEVRNKSNSYIVGIPKESDPNERRVLVTPQGTEELVNQGHRVFVQSGAGKSSNYSDLDYSDYGAEIVQTIDEIFTNADIILNIKPYSLKTIKKLRGNQLIFSSLQDVENIKEYVSILMEKKITAIAPEKIKDKHNNSPVISSMSEIAGKVAIFIAAELLSNTRGGKGVLLGNITGITPPEIIVFGAGKAAETAIKTALAIGATIKVFDKSIYRLQELQNKIGRCIYTSVLQKQVIEKELLSADVVIGAMHNLNENPEFILSNEMVKTMKEGSVIIDLSIDKGGFVEGSRPTTLTNPTYINNGVIHYNVPNVASQVSRTASISLSNIFIPLITQIANCCSFNNAIKADLGLRKGIYVFNGILTDSHIGLKTGIQSRDIELLMAAF